MINVKDLGVKGDGVTDDTDAIQAILDSAAKRIFFPDSTYIITRLLTSNLANRTIEGESMDTLIAQTTSGIGALLVMGNGVDVEKLWLAGTGAVAPDPDDVSDPFQDGPGSGLQIGQLLPNDAGYRNRFFADHVRISGFSVNLKNLGADASGASFLDLGPGGKNLVVQGNQDSFEVSKTTSGAYDIVNVEVRGNGNLVIEKGVWNGSGGGEVFRQLGGSNLTLRSTHIEGLTNCLAVRGDTNCGLWIYDSDIRNPDGISILGGSGFRATIVGTDCRVQVTGEADVRAYGREVPMIFNTIKTRAGDYRTVTNDPSNIPTPSAEHAGQKIKVLSLSGENVREKLLECIKTGAVDGVDQYAWVDLVAP